MQAVGLVRLIRPRQWVKNAFVLAPVVFAREYGDIAAVSKALFAFAFFCIASSASYVANDLHDLERDRRHPAKRLSRPIAAGVVSPSAALVVLGTLYAILAGCWFVAPRVGMVVVAYLALNLLYTFFLKNQPVLDIFSIAIGFVLRVYAGAVALSVPLSSWMAITTLCLALYLAAIKRRQELASSGSEAREVLRKYSVALVDRFAEMSATGALVFYSLYVMSTNSLLVGTIPLVIFGLFRYWYVVDTLDGGESPTDALLTDVQLMLTVLAWVGVCVWMLLP